jgi:DNA-binding transcriptional ArsR family regulator
MYRSLTLSYVLLLCCFVGPAGLHRLYLGKTITGLIYLCTWGLFGIGTLFDALRLPGLVEQFNYLEARKHARPSLVLVPDGKGGFQSIAATAIPGPPQEPPPPPRKTKKEIELELQRQILACAQRNEGEVSVTDVAMATGLTLEDAELRLRKLKKSNYVDVGFRGGVVVYRFLEFLPPEAEDTLHPKAARVRRRLTEKLG